MTGCNGLRATNGGDAVACMADKERWLPNRQLFVSCSSAHGMLRSKPALLQNPKRCSSMHTDRKSVV